MARFRLRFGALLRRPIECRWFRLAERAVQRWLFEGRPRRLIGALGHHAGRCGFDAIALVARLLAAVAIPPASAPPAFAAFCAMDRFVRRGFAVQAGLCGNQTTGIDRCDRVFGRRRGRAVRFACVRLVAIAATTAAAPVAASAALAFALRIA